MTGKPVLAASANENVLFPDPASPVTMTRRPSANGASLIAVSVPHAGRGRAITSTPNDAATRRRGAPDRHVRGAGSRSLAGLGGEGPPDSSICRGRLAL